MTKLIAKSYKIDMMLKGPCEPNPFNSLNMVNSSFVLVYSKLFGLCQNLDQNMQLKLLFSFKISLL